MELGGRISRPSGLRRRYLREGSDGVVDGNRNASGPVVDADGERSRSLLDGAGAVDGLPARGRRWSRRPAKRDGADLGACDRLAVVAERHPRGHGGDGRHRWSRTPGTRPGDDVIASAKGSGWLERSASTTGDEGSVARIARRLRPPRWIDAEWLGLILPRQAWGRRRHSPGPAKVTPMTPRLTDPGLGVATVFWWPARASPMPMPNDSPPATGLTLIVVGDGRAGAVVEPGVLAPRVPGRWRPSVDGRAAMASTDGTRLRNRRMRATPARSVLPTTVTCECPIRQRLAHGPAH